MGEKGMSEAGVHLAAGGALGSGRRRSSASGRGMAGMGLEPSGGTASQQRQLAQMYESVRSLQEENRLLREARNRDGPASDASTDAGADDVSEEEYRALQERLARLQQSHLKQLQEARHLKTRSSASATASAATSGVSTPFSTAGRSSGSTFGPGAGSQDLRVLQAQYQAL